MSTSTPFLQFWSADRTRDTFLSFVPKEDLASFRLVCYDFAARAAPSLFRELAITFRPSTFTKPARIAALDRIGRHVRTLTFTMAHGPETFLPPLIDNITGEELEFVYEPYCHSNRGSSDRSSIPTYGSWELTDTLVKQYPPLFHAAANVPSFIQAFSFLTNARHLKISCPGQEPALRFRRDVVDYALISLRIAVERNKFSQLKALSLLSVHPGAIQYLNPIMGFGALPNSVRRWRQIQDLTIHMDTIPHGPNDATDHFKLVHSYLHTFSSTLKSLVFRWEGKKGLFPLALGAEQTLISNSPGLACPRRCHLALRPLKFDKLIFMEVENVTTDASQVSSFILSHRRSISEFNFEGTTLRSGTWDDALSPLTRMSGSEKWKEKAEEVMDVPLLLSPVGLEDGQMEKVIQDNLRTRCPTPLLGGWQKATAKSKGFFPDHIKRLLKSPMLSWR